MLRRFEEFCAIISSIQHHIQKIERDEMEKYGLKGPYAQYLVTMSRCPEGITAAQLSEMCDKDKAAVSRALAGRRSTIPLTAPSSNSPRRENPQPAMSATKSAPQSSLPERD